MTLDIKTIPPVVIEPGIYGSVEIERKEDHFYLKHSGVEWNIYTVPNMREYHEQWSGYDLAYGDVLISGFGFGQMATWLASKPEVKSVTVIEKCPDIVTAFMSNNTMPSNVIVVIDDANTYSTDKKYDCIIYDHIPNGLHKPEFYKNLCAIAKNIKHDVFWFWSLEFYYAKYYYGMKPEHMYYNPIDFSQFDFSRSWQKLRQVLDMPTIPNLSKDKIDFYMNAYFMRK
jgi:hypothetical protein